LSTIMTEVINKIIGKGRPSGPFQVILGEAELSALANAYAAEHPELDLSNIAIHLIGGEFEITLETKLLRLPMTVRLQGSAFVRNGKIAIEIDKLELNRAPAPGFIRDQIVGAIHQELDPAGWPVSIESLELRTGVAMVTGTAA